MNPHDSELDLRLGDLGEHPDQGTLIQIRDFLEAKKKPLPADGIRVSTGDLLLVLDKVMKMIRAPRS